MQVSDRFHTLKKLNERATQAFQKLFQGRIAIPVTEGTQRTRYDMLIGTAAQRIRKVKELHKAGRSKGEIMLLTGVSAPTIKKYIGMREEDIPADKQTVRGREHDEAVKKLLERAARVRNLRKNGMSVTEITQKTGFTATVVNRYLSADFTGVNAHYGKLEPYRDDVMNLREDGLKYREIHDIIKQKVIPALKTRFEDLFLKSAGFNRIRRPPPEENPSN
jgi:predicted transcriptional regulator